MTNVFSFELPAGAHARMEVLVLELEGETEARHIDADGGRKVSRA